MPPNGFTGVLSVDEFLEKYMPKPDTEHVDTLQNIVKGSAGRLSSAKKALEHAAHGRQVATALVEYLRQVVSDFPEENKPLFADNHTCDFAAFDHEEGDYTRPDIAAGRPGMNTAPTTWDWKHAGTVIELKYGATDVTDDDGGLEDYDDSEDTLDQLGGSARSLLMASRSCFVFLVAIFARRRARIFRFDRSGYKVTASFDWIEDEEIFPTLFWRLYNPTDRRGHMYGDDDTLSTPTEEEKQRMYEALCKNSFYKDYSFSRATAHSLWLKAVRFRNESGTRIAEPVRCFTVGDPISISNGLFSRATSVYRVILEEDADTESPTVYALKDAWRSRCQRPEIDFYDVIAKYCEDNPAEGVDGMARCHGSIDLSVETALLEHDHTLHLTCSETDTQRCHMRSLLTPVGRPLDTFNSTKSLAQAVFIAVQHHQLAYKAGVLHRDISEGNVLFDETMEAGGPAKAFLVDWDCSEFTHGGLENFNTWFPERAAANEDYPDVDESLRDKAGTRPFMAIEIMEDNGTVHGAHHDLESFYWLLVWMILVHTPHAYDASVWRSLCNATAKLGWIGSWTRIKPKKSSLFRLVERLRVAVLEQYPIFIPVLSDDEDDSYGGRTTKPAKLVTYERVLGVFKEILELKEWRRTGDPSPTLPPGVPSPDATKKQDTTQQVEEAASRKRNREDDADSPTIVSEGTTAASSAAAPAPKKAKQNTTQQVGAASRKRDREDDADSLTVVSEGTTAASSVAAPAPKKAKMSSSALPVAAKKPPLRRSPRCPIEKSTTGETVVP